MYCTGDRSGTKSVVVPCCSGIDRVYYSVLVPVVTNVYRLQDQCPALNASNVI